METSEVTQQDEGSAGLLINIKGFISENCDLFQVDLSKFALVTMDFEETTFINSLGIRMWMDWLKSSKVPDTTKIKMINCVPSLVAQFNMIKGFITPNCEVLSLYANYYVEDSSNEHKVLLKLGVDFEPAKGDQEGWVKIAEEIASDSGEELILDTIKEKYFAFLGKVKYLEP